MKLVDDSELDSYWLTFPLDDRLPIGIGVTAYSIEDAYELLTASGIAEWFRDAKQVSIRKSIRIADLDQRHVVPNMGPMQFRGVWYPCMNIGFGSQHNGKFKRFE